MREGAFSGVPSAARMSVSVDVEKVRRIDRGIDLSRTQAGVTKQFLERAQIRTPAEQVSREGMPQRVRRRSVWQAQGATRSPNLCTDYACRQRPAPLPAEQG